MIRKSPILAAYILGELTGFVLGLVCGWIIWN